MEKKETKRTCGRILQRDSTTMHRVSEGNDPGIQHVGGEVHSVQIRQSVPQNPRVLWGLVFKAAGCTHCCDGTLIVQTKKIMM
jgi:hypothetical protein